ncbi:MAG: hypothetical protein WC295_09990 [Methanoregula sp.]|jgi:hypothetical protein
MVTKQVNNVFFAAFFTLIFFTVFIAGCTTPNPGTNIPVTAPSQPVQTSIVPVLEIIGQATTQVQVAQPVNNSNRNIVPNQQPKGPVSLTINSAKKQLILGERDKVSSGPIPGNVYLVLNITVKKNDVSEGFNFNRTSITVRDLKHRKLANRAMYIREALRKYLENPIIFPINMKQNDIITGQVLFDMNDTAEYRLNLVDNNKKVIASQQVSFDSLLTIRNPVDLTIDSVSKVRNYSTAAPMPGHIFLILNVTVKNNDVMDGFVFSWESMDIRDIRGSDYAPHTLNNGPNLMKNLKNPIPPEKNIKQNDSITGQIIFGIADSTQYCLNLIDKNRTVIASRIIYVE